MPPPVGSNWELFIAEQILHGPDEIDLKIRQPGDQLKVMTKNTRYEFDWLEDGGVLLQTDRSDRPWGLVTLTGCAFRRSGIVVPGVAFRGGKLQFLSLQGQVCHGTTIITSLVLVRPGTPGNHPTQELVSAGQ